MDTNARTWKTIAKKYRWVLSRCDHNVRRLSVWQREDVETIKRLRADNARLLDTLAEYMATPDDGVEVDAPPMQFRQELQLCTHPVQAIRSSPYIGEQHSNWCGWCADVARLREAMDRFVGVIERGACAGLLLPAEFWVAYDIAKALLSTPTDDWLAQHDAEVREQAMAEACATLRIAQMQHDAEVRQEERERCVKEVEMLHVCDCGPHWTERGLHSPTCFWAECQGIAQDLRNQEGERHVES